MANKKEISEYRQHGGINYSSLADFYDGPDIALMRLAERRMSQEMAIGNAFEAVLLDTLSGKDPVYGEFGKGFFVHSGNIPASYNPAWIESAANLGQFYIYNKKAKKDESPALNGTYKALHAILDACQEHPGCYPIAADEFAMLCQMAVNMLKTEFIYPELRSGQTVRGKVGDFFTMCTFQQPLYWSDKKALPDAYITRSADNATLVFDLKTSASMSQGRAMVKSRYWIQDIHYTEGLSAVKSGHTFPMIFLFAEKKPPFLCQALTIDSQSREYAMQAYKSLVSEYHDWKTSGCPARGYRNPESIKLYL